MTNAAWPGMAQGWFEAVVAGEPGESEKKDCAG
jgi:hypothetical protein